MQSNRRSRLFFYQPFLIDMRNYQKEFPLTKTKIKGLSRKFDLSDPVERKKYFKKKAGPEIKLLKKYFKSNTFIVYFLGKKISGKGTYTKLMTEIFGQEKIGHVSVGDIVRVAHQDMKDPAKKKDLMEYLIRNYRGYISLDQAIEALLSRDTETLMPTEFILTLVKREIDKMDKKSLFIDGFPRDLDQISYALFFRDLINYRTDPDIFVAIDIPESVIDARIKGRVICPKCHTPRNLKLFMTKKVAYDKKKKQFYLACDNPSCQGARMIEKEGDRSGIKLIRNRMKLDDQLTKRAFSLHGISRVLLRNAVPVKLAKDYIDDYEITMEYSCQLDPKTNQVKVSEKPWVVKDDQGRDAYSLQASPVAISLVKQLVKVLDLK